MGRWAPLGVALAGTTVVALALLTDASAPPPAAIVGLALLAGAGQLTPAGKLAVGMALAAPGAALIGFAGDLDHPAWMAAAATGVIAVAAPLVADADRRWAPAGGGPLAFAIATTGMFGCVPDTEEARVLLVAALLAAAVSRLPQLRVLGSAGAVASTGVFVWIAAFDARGRPSAAVGAVAALALLVWVPLGARMRGVRGARVHGRAAWLCVGVGHVVLAAYASRVVGLERSVGSALALAVPGALAGLAIGMIAGAMPRGRATNPLPG